MKEEEELDGFHKTSSDDSIQADDDVLEDERVTSARLRRVLERIKRTHMKRKSTLRRPIPRVEQSIDEFVIRDLPLDSFEPKVDDDSVLSSPGGNLGEEVPVQA